ncbi:tyrosyl-DNA phosphodiesterase 1 [Tanacetum coccineum]
MELADALGRHKVDIACFQETKWKGSSTREGNGYKLWYSGSSSGRNRVGVILTARLRDNVVQVSRCGDRIMALSVDDLDEIVRECPTDQHLFIGGDLNGHIGSVADGYTGVHGGFGFGARNKEGRAILEFATAHDLVVANSFFKKREAHLITFQSRSHNTQIDFLLVRRGDLRTCKDCRAFPSEACSSQHRLVTLDVLFERQRHRREATGRARILWKNLKGDVAETFKATVSEKLSALEEDMSTSSAEQMWNTLAHTIKDVARDSLGVVSESARTHSTHRESWWFSEEVQTKVAAKQSRFKELLSCREGNLEGIDSATERYKLAKREAKIAGGIPRREVEVGKLKPTFCLKTALTPGSHQPGNEGVKWLTCLFNKIFSSAKMPDEWRLSEVIPIYKNKATCKHVATIGVSSSLDHPMEAVW